MDENPKASQFPPYVMATERERDNPRAQISRRILHSEEQFDYDEWTRDGFNTKILEAELRIPDLVKEWEALSSKEPDRAAKLKEPVELLKGWDCISAVDSVAMTLFVEAYDRVMKMIAKRDLPNYPTHSRARSDSGGPGENARQLESGLGRDQSACSGFTARRSTCKAMARFATISRVCRSPAHRGPWASSSISTRCLKRARSAATGSPAIPSSGPSSWRRNRR